MAEYLNNPLVRGAFSGFLAAAVIDFQAFRKFKTVDEFAAYDWRVAGFRWAQGAVIGLLGSTVSIFG
jgi:hypothetical protein